MTIDKDKLLQIDADHIVHWITPIGDKTDRIFSQSSGVSFIDTDGKGVLDGSSQLVCVSLGYGYNDEIAEAAADQLRKLPYMTTFWGLTSDAIIKFTERLNKFMPDGLDHYCFTNGGSESTELSFQLARIYWKQMGVGGKYKIISLHNSYHGTSFGASSSTGIFKGKFSSGYAPLVPGFIKAPSYYCYRCMLDLEYPSCGVQCAKQVEKMIELEGADSIAAFIAEPVHGTAGDISPPPEYWPMIREICDKHDILLIADEVMTGFGRTGKAFCVDHWDVKPDMITMGKGIVSSYIPFGGVALNEKVWDGLEGLSIPGATYSGHPVAAAVANKVLEIYERDDIFQNVVKMGDYAMKRLNEEFLPLPFVAEISGKGLMIGIEIVEDKKNKKGFDPESGKMNQIRDLAYENGLLIRVSDQSWGPSNRISFGPPLISNKEQIDEMLDILYSVLKTVLIDKDET
jgi:putrescine aminotransferase